MERRVDGGVVAASVRVPASDDEIVLLDPDQRPEGVEAWHPFHNILRLGSAGDVLWRAELLPSETTAKCWTGVSFDDALRATTYSWVCELDPDSGRIVSSMFVK